ncbi:DUF3168 domain-containing protein [Streptomyces albipurpureus]|uniref:DUF3168 domain-containing protein n=1 Tax=Streptomyces albipurpureus TaxID=2897419 RepID=A0ABT0UPC5_9ACTN|nr:DUF3168 domain-containing protein [Streptomyces sp. CWNU-1]MCM2390197.1 DUF3168 domain-containing protein [Streptomyces sp. CWNU-1]
MTTPPPLSPLLPILDAIRIRQTGDPALMALISGVYDWVPESATYPYIVIGEATEIPDNRHRGYGWQTTITQHVWTRHRGHSKGLAIGARVTALLDHQPLTVTGFHHVVTRFEFQQTLTDPEPPGDIRHLVLRYRVITEQPN